jgi:undecaprenyl-diphosphatase
MEQLLQWDDSLFFLLNGSDSIFWDRFFMLVTKTATWIPAMLVLLFVVIRNNKSRTAAIVVIALVLTVVLSDRITSGLIKPWIMRMRPSHNPDIMYLVDTVDNYRGGLYGFCSSHAANTFGAALFLSRTVRSSLFTFVLFLWAVLCSYSRIYLGVHYPGDILCGAVCGMVIALVTYGICSLFTRDNRNGVYFVSSRYTSTGYRIQDVEMFIATLFLTIVVVMIVALCTAI